MSRTLSDDDLLALADRLDWWTPSWRGPHAMCTLRQALALALAHAPDPLVPVSLFRAGLGKKLPAVWLQRADIERLWDKLQTAAAA
jgi:hypothetical protein